MNCVRHITELTFDTSKPKYVIVAAAVVVVVVVMCVFEFVFFLCGKNCQIGSEVACVNGG